MIVRSLVLRQGRRALAKPPARTWKRLLASQADSIEASLQNSLKETHSIEAVINSQALHPVQPIDDVSHATAETRSVAEDYSTFKRQQELTRHLGTSISPHYQPHTLVTNPPSPQDITLELLLASQAHLGHSTSLWNPANARYIFGIRQGVHIIDLSTIAAHLRRACKIVEGVTSRGGLVLFVGTRPGQDRCVVKAAELAQGCHLFERWIPGSITNGQQILRRCRMKVVDEFDRDVPGFELQLLDRAVLKPDLVVCLNPLENYVLLHECGLNNIPTIGVIDTDADPTWVTYPIPANDDSIRCVQVIAGVLGRAGEAGQALRHEAAKLGSVTYTPAEGLFMPEGAGSTSEQASDDPSTGNGIEEDQFLRAVRAHAAKLSIRTPSYSKWVNAESPEEKASRAAAGEAEAQTNDQVEERPTEGVRNVASQPEDSASAIEWPDLDMQEHVPTAVEDQGALSSETVSADSTEDSAPMAEEAAAASPASEPATAPEPATTQAPPQIQPQLEAVLRALGMDPSAVSEALKQQLMATLAQSQSQSQSQSQPPPQPLSEPQSQAPAPAQPEIQTQAQPEARPETQAQPQAQAQPTSQSQPESQSSAAAPASAPAPEDPSPTEPGSQSQTPASDAQGEVSSADSHGDSDGKADALFERWTRGPANTEKTETSGNGEDSARVEADDDGNGNGNSRSSKEGERDGEREGRRKDV